MITNRTKFISGFNIEKYNTYFPQPIYYLSIVNWMFHFHALTILYQGTDNQSSEENQ